MPVSSHGIINNDENNVDSIVKMNNLLPVTKMKVVYEHEHY